MTAPRVHALMGPPLRIMVDPNATPIAYHTPIPVPLHWRDDVMAGLEGDARHGVLEPVPIGEPVTWCHRMVVVAKKTGKLRRTVDYQPLNKHATRETHHTQSPFHLARSVPHGTKKTVFDAWNGYHSVPLHPDDKHFTTFLTPWGRYRYLVAPRGYISSGDGYTRLFGEIVSDIPDKIMCVDDALLHSKDLTTSFSQAVEWIDPCGRHGVTLNPDKFVFGQDTVEFAGFEITPDNVRPCKKYLDAIREFQTPANITDIHSWFGLINQVSYAFTSAERMLPFHELLKPGTPFAWEDELNTVQSSHHQPKSRMASGSLTNQSPLAWPPIGQRRALDTGCSRNTATAHPQNHSAVAQAGASHSWGVALLTLLSHVMPLLRGRPWQWLTP